MKGHVQNVWERVFCRKNLQNMIQSSKITKIQASINRIRKSKYKSAVKKMSEYISSNKMKEAKEYLPKFYSQLMKVAKTGVIKKRTASRTISKFTKKIQKK